MSRHPEMPLMKYDTKCAHSGLTASRANSKPPYSSMMFLSLCDFTETCSLITRRCLVLVSPHFLDKCISFKEGKIKDSSLVAIPLSKNAGAT
ncbi:hypothetical protein CDAR_606211 [Caerostris darwini]|uniref:Uncharacterized protein n=1 Tax=Caerostris darwini TaxID=1538125 RepID=A0AAV4PZP6_9ARAC|nr:hypothetical protein CDAR_606211 [Caerostris darwini]